MHADDLQKLLSHGDWLRSLARSLARDQSTADDAVQETFLTAIRARPDVDRSLRPWLRRVLERVLQQRHRGERRRESREHATDLGTDREVQAAVDAAAQSELYRTLAREVHQLDEPYRTAIVLRYFQGRSTPEIAAQLGVPESTVRSRLSRGHEKLRARLDDRYEDRRAWVALVLPLVRRAAPVATTSASSPAVSLAFTAAIVLATAAVWWDGRASGGEGRPERTVAEGPANAAVAVPDRPVRGASGETAAARVPAPRDEGATGALVVTGRAVFREGGVPVVGSHVDVGHRPARGRSPWSGVGLTDATGRFTVHLAEAPADVREGSIVERLLLVDMTGLLLIRGSTHAVRVDGPLDLTARPGAGTEADPFDLGTIEVERGVEVSGRIEEAGRPVAGARLLLVPTRDLRDSLPLRGWLEVGATGSDGSFVLSERVTRTAATDFAGTLVLVLEDGRFVHWEPLPVEADGDSIEILMRVRRGDLVVRVVDAAGRPVAGADVRVVPWIDPERAPRRNGPGVAAWTGQPGLRANTSGRSDVYGRVAFSGLPTPGGGARYQVDVSSERFGGETMDVRVSEAGSATLEVALSPPAALALRVVDDGNRPVAGARVLVDASEVGRTSAGGRLSVPLDRGRPAMLRVDAEGYAVRWETLRPAGDGERRSLEVRLRRAVTTSVVLVDRHGLPPAGVRAELRRGSDPAVKPTHADFDVGRFTFERTDGGEYRVSLQGRDPTEGTGGWVLAEPAFVTGGRRDQRVEAERVHPSRTDVVVEVRDAVSGAPLRSEKARLYGRMLLESGRLLSSDRVFGGVARTRGSVDVAAVPPGEWILELRFADRPTAYLPLAIEPGEPSRRTSFDIGRGATIVLRIEGEDADAAPDVEVRRARAFAWDAPGPLPVAIEATSDPHTFRVSPVPAGAVVVTVESRGRTVPKSLEAPPSGEVVEVVRF